MLLYNNAKEIFVYCPKQPRGIKLPLFGLIL